MRKRLILPFGAAEAAEFEIVGAGDGRHHTTRDAFAVLLHGAPTLTMAHGRLGDTAWFYADYGTPIEVQTL